jgi:hypothetical protein
VPGHPEIDPTGCRLFNIASSSLVLFYLYVRHVIPCVIRAIRTNDGFSAMKMKAIIEVEFEANEDQDENVLRAALFRGRSGLAESIEHGTGRASTGVKAGSVKIEITKSEVSD